MDLALCGDGEKVSDTVSLGNWYDLDTSSHTGFLFFFFSQQCLRLI